MRGGRGVREVVGRRTRGCARGALGCGRCRSVVRGPGTWRGRVHVAGRWTRCAPTAPPGVPPPRPRARAQGVCLAPGRGAARACRDLCGRCSGGARGGQGAREVLGEALRCAGSAGSAGSAGDARVGMREVHWGAGGVGWWSEGRVRGAVAFTPCQARWPVDTLRAGGAARGPLHPALVLVRRVCAWRLVGVLRAYVVTCAGGAQGAREVVRVRGRREVHRARGGAQGTREVLGRCGERAVGGVCWAGVVRGVR